MKMKKLAAVAAGMLILAGTVTSHAYWQGTFVTPYESIGTTEGYDWLASGSGDADIPTNQILPGATFDFRYQASLVGFMQPNGQPIPGANYPGLNTDYEVTIVAMLPETVTYVIPLGGTAATAGFTSLGGTFAMYYDDLNDATGLASNVAAGTGFNDGQLILSGTFNGGTLSTFTATKPGNGIGSFAEQGLLSFVDDDFFDPDLMVDSVFGFGFRIEGTLNQPALESGTVNFFDGNDGFGVYTVQAGDQLFKVDASSRLPTVPEPSTLLLLGAGLLGVAGFARRNKSK